MRPEERETLRRRFAFRCGYCGVSERDSGAELTVDHFQPRSQGGRHEPDNWVYCCHACNEFKGDFWNPDSPRRIMHPLREDLTAHLAEHEDGTLRSLTETGSFHIAKLNLNRSQLIAFRSERRRLEGARRIQQNLLDRLKQLEGQVQAMTAELERLESGSSR